MVTGQVRADLLTLARYEEREDPPPPISVYATPVAPFPFGPMTRDMSEISEAIHRVVGAELLTRGR